MIILLILKSIKLRKRKKVQKSIKDMKHTENKTRIIIPTKIIDRKIIFKIFLTFSLGIPTSYIQKNIL